MKSNIISKMAILTFVVIGLSGCDEEEKARIKEQREHPEVQHIGVIDGCDVSYVARGTANESFYLAKCGATTTTTQQFMERSGKSEYLKTKTTIVQELAEVTKQKAVLEARLSALKKLSPEEQAALGLQPDTGKAVTPDDVPTSEGK